MSGEPRWVRVGAASDLRFRPGASVEVAGLEVAIFSVDGRFFALQNSCPHAGAALADGDQDGAAITCLRHGFTFDIRTGACVQVADDRARTFPVREVDGALEILVPGEPSAPDG